MVKKIEEVKMKLIKLFAWGDKKREKLREDEGEYMYKGHDDDVAQMTTKHVICISNNIGNENSLSLYVSVFIQHF